MVGDIGAQGAVLEYNLLGDPSMPLHRDVPLPIQDTLVRGALVDAAHVAVSTTQGTANGALVTLVRDGQYIGRGIVTDGTADVSTIVDVTTLNGVQAIIGGDPFVAGTVDLGSSG
jgi:hypothetical protein